MAKLGEMLKVPGRSLEVVDNFLNKRITKEILKKGGVRIPKYVSPELENCKKDL